MSPRCSNLVTQDLTDLASAWAKTHDYLGRKLEFPFDEEWIKVSFLESTLTMALCSESGPCRCDLAGFGRHNNRRYYNWSHFIQVVQDEFLIYSSNKD